MLKAHGRAMGRDGFPQANKHMASSEHVLKLTPSRMLAFVAAHGNKADKAKSNRQKKTNVCKWVEKTLRWQTKPLNATTGLVHRTVVQDDLQGRESWWKEANWGTFIKKTSIWCKEKLWSCTDEPARAGWRSLKPIILCVCLQGVMLALYSSTIYIYILSHLLGKLVSNPDSELTLVSLFFFFWATLRAHWDASNTGVTPVIAALNCCL